MSDLDQARAELQRWQIIVDYLEHRTVAPTMRRRRGSRNGKVTVAVAAERVLQKADGPVKTRDLVAAVRAEGASIKDGEGLTKTLNRHPRFKKAGRGLWTLAS